MVLFLLHSPSLFSPFLFLPVHLAPFVSNFPSHISFVSCGCSMIALALLVVTKLPLTSYKSLQPHPRNSKMGCCCSVDEDAIKAERQLRNPLDPHPDWVEKMKADMQRDVFSVCRDFPRMSVHLVDPCHKDVHGEVGGAGGGQQHGDAIERETVRCRKVLNTIANIAKMVGDADIAERVEKWFAAFVVSPDSVLLDQPDMSPILRKMFVDTGIVVPRGGSSASPSVLSSSAGCEVAAAATAYEANRKTFRVLECLVQGVVFFPLQRMHFLLWFPWCSRLTDLKWTSFVFTRSGFHEHVYVVHRQISRNYVPPESEGQVPPFEFEWDIVITLDATTAEVVTAEMQMRQFTVFESRIDVTCPCSSSANSRSLKETRVADLSQRVLDAFNVEVSVL